jgi:hypothetical protein
MDVSHCQHEKRIEWMAQLARDGIKDTFASLKRVATSPT